MPAGGRLGRPSDPAVPVVRAGAGRKPAAVKPPVIDPATAVKAAAGSVPIAPARRAPVASAPAPIGSALRANGNPGSAAAANPLVRRRASSVAVATQLVARRALSVVAANPPAPRRALSVPPVAPPCPAVLKKVASAIAPPPIDDRRIVVPATVVLRTVAPVSAGSVIAARPIGARWIAGLLKAGLPIGIAAPVPSEVGHRLVGLGCSVPPVAARPAPISALRRSVPIAINRATPLERRWRQTPLRLLLPTT